jgi:hypothetical protein
MSETTSSESSLSALESWSGLTQTPDLVNYFQGVFHSIGIEIQETGEQLTVTHDGDSISLAPGIDKDVDFQVHLLAENVTNLVGFAQDGVFDAYESWRIVRVLFTPLTKAALAKPVFSQEWVRKMAGVESLIHVYLDPPPGTDPPATHTLIYAADQWLVLSGLHGLPRRVFRLTADDALDFQRQLYRALRTNTFTGWWQFAGWYREWRRTVSGMGT